MARGGAESRRWTAGPFMGIAVAAHNLLKSADCGVALLPRTLAILRPPPGGTGVGDRACRPDPCCARPSAGRAFARGSGVASTRLHSQWPLTSRGSNNRP
jgi:hypothetical protein